MSGQFPRTNSLYQSKLQIALAMRERYPVDVVAEPEAGPRSLAAGLDMTVFSRHRQALSTAGGVVGGDARPSRLSVFGFPCKRLPSPSHRSEHSGFLQAAGGVPPPLLCRRQCNMSQELKARASKHATAVPTRSRVDL